MVTIKSYFDHSIQTAMRQARHELGDDVILVTSRVASPELRHLGDFEVVCAGDEQETEPKQGNLAEPAAGEFEQIFRQQLAQEKLHVEGAGEAGIAIIRWSLVDIGLEAALADALIVLVRFCAPLHSELVSGEPLPSPPGVGAAPPGLAGRHSRARTDNTSITLQAPSCTADEGEAGFARLQQQVTTDATLRVSGWAVPNGASAASEMEGPQVVAMNTELATRRSSEETPARKELARSCETAHASRGFVKPSRVAARSGFMMILAALGLYRMTRRSGA
jgi:hypothetical protein